MNLLTKFACLASLLAVTGAAAEAPQLTLRSADLEPAWDSSAQTIESGVLWQIGTLTSFPYRLLETQYSWKSRPILSRAFNDGSRILLRNRFALIGAVIQQGPESHYLALSASPSIEWWNAANTWSVYFGSGGGFGLVDSQRVTGALGQDFTLNWLIRTGVEHVISRNQRISAGIMYQHMSNGGMTDPNPGIDALGFMIGYSWNR